MRHAWPLNWYRGIDTVLMMKIVREKRAIVICKWYADTKPAQCQQILKKPCSALLCLCVCLSWWWWVLALRSHMQIANPCGWSNAKTPKTSLVLFVFGALQTSPALTHADPAEPSLEISPWVEFLSWFHAKDDLPFSFSFTIFLFLFSFPIFCACVAVSLWVSGKIFALWSWFFLYKLIEIWRYFELEKLSGFYSKVNEIC